MTMTAVLDARSGTWGGPAPTSTALTLARQPTSVGAARHAVEALCVGGHEDAGALVALLVSEVVTNALVHGSGCIRLTALLGERLLRVGVQDDGEDQPHVRRPAETDEGGRGLAMLDLLSAAWGVERHHRGKTVWFVVALED